MVLMGALHALAENGEVDSSVSALPISEGSNTFGRNDSKLFSKQVSRKHVSITASPNGTLEISVEGPNPVVVQSGADRLKLPPKSKRLLVNNDVIEFIPGDFPFKYIARTSSVLGTDNNSVATVFTVNYEAKGTDLISSGFLEEGEVMRKRKSQVLEDEAFARLLQEEEDRSAGDGFGVSGTSHTDSNGRDSLAFLHSQRTGAGSERFRGEPSAGFGASRFHLMHTENLSRLANMGCVRIQDVIQGDIQLAILSNYMVDVTWLLSACPVLHRALQVVMVHGETGQSLQLLHTTKPKNWILFKPSLPLAYGTHHSKAMFLVYPTGVRVVVHTANLIHGDWNNKTQGLWMQDFPLKSNSGHMEKSHFEDDLVEYLEALEWPGCTLALPHLGVTRVSANFFRRFDFSSASVRLVASVPGYHRGRNLSKWGHMKLRTVLQDQLFEDQFQGSNLVYQFSSLGSLDESWMKELTISMSAGSTFGKKPLGLGKVQIVWPTVEDVRCSIEGYAAGGAVPSPEKNVKKEFLKKYWARWKAEHMGRSRAIPHLKSYVRYSGQSLAWFVLTSSNLSKAAWGSLQKNSTQIMIRSYELGVCFLPSLVLRSTMQVFSCTESRPSLLKSLAPLIQSGSEHHSYAKLVTSVHENKGGEQCVETLVKLPVPYSLPPPPYASEDMPWSWDCQYRQPDVYGQFWP